MRAGWDAASVAAELAGTTLFVLALVVHTLSVEADLVVLATVGVAVVFHTNASFALLALLAGGVTAVAVADAVAATRVGCGALHVLTRIIHTGACRWVTNLTLLAVDVLALVVDAGAFVTDLVAFVALHAVARIFDTGAIFTDLAGATGHTCASLHTLTAAAELSRCTGLVGTQINHTHARLANLTVGTAKGVTIRSDTGVAFTDFVGRTNRLTRGRDALAVAANLARRTGHTVAG